MKLGALIGWGIVIYAVLFLVWSGLVIQGFSGFILSRVVILATLVIVTTIATRSLRLTNERDIAPYAFGWVVVAAGLDVIFSVPSAGWVMYSNWNLWVGYFLLLAVPFVVTALSGRRASE